MAVSSIGHPPPYQPPAHSPPKPPEHKQQTEKYWEAKPNPPPKPSKHKVDVSA